MCNCNKLLSGTPFLITPSNSANLVDETGRPVVTTGISFATAGALSIVTVNDVTVTIPSGALAAGIIHPIRAKRIRSTGTGASGIVGYYPGEV